MKAFNLIRLLFVSALGVTSVSLLSCNGILDSIYDNVDSTISGEYGFIKVDESNNSGRIYIDATKYTNWIYIDFHDKSIDSLDITTSKDEPSVWDLAVHRYDAKTNSGSVVETNLTDFSQLSGYSINENDFVKDVPSKVIIDMSGMMDGNILYSESNVNMVLSKWLNVDKSSMPPVYTLSEKVYLVKFSDGTIAAVKLSDFMNKSLVKGYMTIDYVYPLDL